MTFSRFPQADLDALLDATPPQTEHEQEQPQMGDFEAARGILPWREGEEPPEVRLRRLRDAADHDDEQAEAAYEASVQDRLSDLASEGSWWCYGYVYPVTIGDAARGWGVWLASAGPQDSDTNSTEQWDDWSTFDECEGETEARDEATRRNRGEG